MSHLASTWAWSQKVTNPKHKLLLVKLADSANDDGVCWPSLRTLAKHTGLSKSALSRMVKSLEEAQLLRIQPTMKQDGSAGANVYHLHLEGCPTQGGTRVSHKDGTGVSHLERDTVSHPGRDRTVKEPSVEPKTFATAGAAAPPEHLGDRRWRIASTRKGKGPFVVDLDAGTCTCENRFDTPCRHIRSAAKADEGRVKKLNGLLHSAVWEAFVACFGKHEERRRSARVALITDTKEHLVNEGVEATPEAWGGEVKRRVAALTADWGVGKVTPHSFVLNFVLAGKLANGVKADTTKDARFNQDEMDLLAGEAR